MSRMTKEEMLAHLGGSAENVDQELSAFSAAADVLSSDHPRLIDQHPLQWVGVHQGQVAASAQTMNSLLEQLKNLGVPAEHTIVRFINKEEKTLIL